MTNSNVSHLASRFPHLMHGYTLIELLITVSLTAMLITFGISSYRIAADRQAIKSETELILTILTQAQKAATSGKTDCSGPYLGEKVEVNVGSPDLRVQSICSYNPQGEVRTQSLKNFRFTGNHNIIFRPLNQGIDVGDGSNLLNLEYTNDTNTYRIEISRSGSIKALGAI